MSSATSKKSQQEGSQREPSLSSEDLVEDSSDSEQGLEGSGIGDSQGDISWEDTESQENTESTTNDKAEVDVNVRNQPIGGRTFVVDGQFSAIPGGANKIKSEIENNGGKVQKNLSATLGEIVFLYCTQCLFDSFLSYFGYVAKTISLRTKILKRRRRLRKATSTHLFKSSMGKRFYDCSRATKALKMKKVWKTLLVQKGSSEH